MTPALQTIRERAPQAKPRIVVLLGSGWGGFTQRLQSPVRIPYADLAGFAPSGVAGHAGELWLGRIGGVEVAVLSGRRHAYETGEPDGMRAPLATLRDLGCDTLVQTNAAGSLHAAMPAGSLMLVADHLNLPQRSPLVGEHGDGRFVGMVDAYDPRLRALARDAAAQAGVMLHEGVYAWALGPQFETPAEIRMLRTLGADAVGMSTVPETIVARRLGMRVLALSLITNLAAGMSDIVPSHAQTLAQGEAAGEVAGRVLEAVVIAVVIAVGAGSGDERGDPGMTDAGVTGAAQRARTALRCLDLTSLSDADSAADIERLCRRAQSPFGHVAAVCVWPRFAAMARARLPAEVRVAAVANFPAGGGDIAAAVAEVQAIAAAGAQEVDVVLPWRALLAGDEAAASALLRAVRAASPGLVLKVILETGELRVPALIARASTIAIDAGADFLKTSTGKVPIGATPAAAEAMLRAIAAHPQARDRVGLKVSGGIHHVADVEPYLDLCARFLGEAALQARRFRIGASRLLDDIEAVLGAVPGAGSD